MKEYQAALFDAAKYRLAESPFYDPRYDRLSWVDIQDGKVFWRRDGVTCVHEFGEPVGAAVPLAGEDGFLVAGERTLWKLCRGEQTAVCDLSGAYLPWQRSNDAKADPHGRLFVGSCAKDFTGMEGGDLYRCDRGVLTVMQPGTRIANGMAWSADRKTFWFSDSNEHAVFAYDFDEESGDIADRRVLFPVEGGVPDGMCVDAEDRLWLAVWGGSRIECRDGHTGELLALVRVPGLHTTSCCFVGPDWRRLFITTAGDGLTGEGDGRLYMCDVDAVGLPPDYAVV